MSVNMYYRVEARVIVRAGILKSDIRHTLMVIMPDTAAAEEQVKKKAIQDFEQKTRDSIKKETPELVNYEISVVDIRIRRITGNSEATKENPS